MIWLFLLDELLPNPSSARTNRFEELQCTIRIFVKLSDPYDIEKNTSFRDNVSARERLVVTLKYLATGNTYRDLKVTVLIS